MGALEVLSRVPRAHSLDYFFLGERGARPQSTATARNVAILVSMLSAVVARGWAAASGQGRSRGRGGSSGGSAARLRGERPAGPDLGRLLAALELLRRGGMPSYRGAGAGRSQVLELLACFAVELAACGSGGSWVSRVSLSVYSQVFRGVHGREVAGGDVPGRFAALLSSA